jgi:hypothetical protein
MANRIAEIYVKSGLLAVAACPKNTPSSQCLSQMTWQSVVPVLRLRREASTASRRPSHRTPKNLFPIPSQRTLAACAAKKHFEWMLIYF